jgi:hypothetical protein
MTGSERTPIWLSPLIDLKSFRVMTPCAPKLNSKANTMVSCEGMAPPNMTAAPVTQASPS